MKFCPEWKGFCGGAAAASKKNSKCHLLWKGATLGLLLAVIILVANVDKVSAATANTDPYKILGVQKHATLQDIRKAYKQLAKEW